MMETLSWFLTLASTLALLQDQAPAWKTITSKPGGFTVAMPDTPMEKKHKVETATGHLNVTMLVAEGRNDSVFVVSYSDLPEADLKQGAVDRRLDQARDGAVASARGKLRSEKPVQIDGHPGREIVVEKNGAIVVRMRIFLVQRRLYQVMVLRSGNVMSAKEAGMFLDSFRLIK